MAHTFAGEAYHRLVHRLNRFPQGAPASRRLFEILRLLVNEREAELLALLPLLPFTPEKAAKAWKMNAVEARNILESLTGRGLLLDMVDEKEDPFYVLPPPMAGFFEFSMMRTRQDIDQKVLGKLFYEYLNVEEDFIRALFAPGESSFARVFVHEPALEPLQSIEILDYEKASEVIRTAACIGVSICYCRHKMAHVGRDCNAPKEICLTFGFVADSLIRHGFARWADSVEALDILQRAYDLNLVQSGENVRRNVSFICNCCRCCCEGLIAARKLGHIHPVWTTPFLPEVNPALCTGCRKCTEVCPVDAVSVAASDGNAPGRRQTAVIDETVCLGCGLCVRNCPLGAISLKQRARRIITPLDSFHRTVVMAIERGLLQNLIFNNQALTSHRAMAAVLGVILRLPPIKQILASRQLQSRWLEAAICWRAKGGGWMKLVRDGLVKCEQPPQDLSRFELAERPRSAQGTKS